VHQHCCKYFASSLYLRVLNRKQYFTLKAKQDNGNWTMSVGKALSNTAFWKVYVSVNKYKGYTQLGPLVRASLHRRTPKTRLRLIKKYDRQGPKSHSCAVQRNIVGNTPTYDTSIPQHRSHKSGSFTRHNYSLKQRYPNAEEDMLFCSLLNKS
jgi:hypothetical protein